MKQVQHTLIYTILMPADQRFFHAEFLESLPVDPFTWKSLVYRKAGEGFLLYSLGPNRKDDGGKPESHLGHWLEEDFDIVWQCRR